MNWERLWDGLTFFASLGLAMYVNTSFGWLVFAAACFVALRIEATKESLERQINEAFRLLRSEIGR